MGDKRKLQRWKEDRRREEEINIEVEKQALERKLIEHFERKELENEEERKRHEADNTGRVMCLVKESEAQSVVTSPCSLQELEIETTEPEKEEQAEQEGLLRKEEEQSDVVKKLWEPLNRTRLAEEDGDGLENEVEEACLLEEMGRKELLGDDLSETSQITQSETSLSGAEHDGPLGIQKHQVEEQEITEEAAEETLSNKIGRASCRGRV